jgi:hypothetical protein
MSNHNDNVYEVVVTHYNKETKMKTIVYGPKALIARNEDAARMCAVREVDSKYDCNDLSVQARAFI